MVKAAAGAMNFYKRCNEIMLMEAWRDEFLHTLGSIDGIDSGAVELLDARGDRESVPVGWICGDEQSFLRR